MSAVLHGFKKTSELRSILSHSPLLNATTVNFPGLDDREALESLAPTLRSEC